MPYTNLRSFTRKSKNHLFDREQESDEEFFNSAWEEYKNVKQRGEEIKRAKIEAKPASVAELPESIKVHLPKYAQEVYREIFKYVGEEQDDKNEIKNNSNTTEDV